MRSYWRDLEWLRFCLASIDKYCRGFSGVVVVLPRGSEAWWRRCDITPATGTRLEWCADYRDDYLGQQVTKLHADLYTQADFVCHVDSDCVFDRPTWPADLIVDGRPRIQIRATERLGRAYPWKNATEKFLAWPVETDYMQAPPFCYPRWLYSRVRDHSLAQHALELETYVLAQPSRGFSEHNVLGAYAWRYHHEAFRWIDGDTDLEVKRHCRWYWSWGGMDRATRAELSALLELACG